MSGINWQSIWQASQENPYKRAALALMLLNGLTINQIQHLDEAAIDLQMGWITTRDGDTYPLVSYASDVLTTLFDRQSVLSATSLKQACLDIANLENEALRRLSGAIWITDEELQLTLETTGSTETPILPLRFTFPFSIAQRLESDEASAIAERARSVLQNAADWLVEQTLTSQVSLPQRIFGLLRQGSLVFLVTSTGVSGLNLIHNVLMGRLLSPADYSQLTFIITLQLLIGLLPTVMQTVIARFTARYQAYHDESLLSALYQQVGRLGWFVGLLLGAGVLVTSPLLVHLFQLDSIGLLLPVIIALPFFVRMGADRGMLQGLGGYFWLSGAYLSEGIIRLGMGVILGYALLTVGRSLEGAIWGVAQSMLVTWFISWIAIRHFKHTSKSEFDITPEKKDWIQLGWMTALVLIGQALITNSDFLLVKNFFSPDDAGLYAAVSVLGRIVYFGALPLTILLVPLVARRQALNEPTRPILMLLIGGGTLVCSLLIIAALIFSGDILGILYGANYISAANLLAPYALAASLYTLTNLVITYQIALGSGGETWMPILAGSAQIGAVLIFHESLLQVITIQIILMSLLFGVVLWRVLRPGTNRIDEQQFAAQVAG